MKENSLFWGKTNIHFILESIRTENYYNEKTCVSYYYVSFLLHIQNLVDFTLFYFVCTRTFINMIVTNCLHIEQYFCCFCCCCFVCVFFLIENSIKKLPGFSDNVFFSCKCRQIYSMSMIWYISELKNLSGFFSRKRKSLCVRFSKD